MKNKHLIVVSVDALVYEDLEYAKTLPSFSKIMDNCAMIEKVKSIYPSLTHPAHYTMMTGCTTGKTGVISNEVFEVGNEYRHWYNHISETTCETIFHAAHNAGLTTASCCWPGTACGHECIDYLIPGVFDYDYDRHPGNPLDAFRELGASEEMIDIVKDEIPKYDSLTAHPQFDEFQMTCAAEIIRRHKPNLLLCHPSYVDDARHRSGLFSDKVNEAIRRTDEWLGMLLDAVHDAGIEESTDFVVLSDHGHMNICRVMCPNVYLADAGLIKVDEKGNIISWDAFIISSVLSGQVYLSRPDDKNLYNKVYELLKKMADEKIYGFESVFKTEEVKQRYGLYGDFSFVIETDGYTSFNESACRPVVRGHNIDDYRYGKSTHGHMPEKGPQPVLIGKGPSFKSGVTLPFGRIIDHAPTLAKILGVSLSDADGIAVDELLNL